MILMTSRFRILFLLFCWSELMQGQVPQDDPNPIPTPQNPTQTQDDPGQTRGQAETQDQLPPDAPRGQPIPKRPQVIPRPNPDPATPPPLTPAPPAPSPLPEPAPRPQATGPKTAEQRAYESAMQTRWKAAADEIALLGSRGEKLQGKKSKAFRESLRTAAGNRSMARTKLSQLMRASSADFDKLKTGVDHAFADLDASVAKVRSYFSEPPAP